MCVELPLAPCVPSGYLDNHHEYPRRPPVDSSCYRRNEEQPGVGKIVVCVSGMEPPCLRRTKCFLSFELDHHGLPTLLMVVQGIDSGRPGNRGCFDATANQSRGTSGRRLHSRVRSNNSMPHLLRFHCQLLSKNRARLELDSHFCQRI